MFELALSVSAFASHAEIGLVNPSQSPFVICEICERLGGFASPQNLVYCDAVQEDGMPLS